MTNHENIGKQLIAPFIVGATLALFLSAGRLKCDEAHAGWPSKQTYNSAQYDGLTPLVRIVSNPETFNGKFICTQGYYNGYLFLSKADSQNFIPLNAVGIELKKGAEIMVLPVTKHHSDLSDIRENYVYVEGLFTYKRCSDCCPNGEITASRIVQHR